MSESTVTVGGMELTSNSESAEEMVEALKPKEKQAPEPKVLKDRGQPSEEKQTELSKAAAELGKAGGKAAAEKRGTEEKVETPSETKPEAKPEPKPESRPDQAPKERVLAYFQEHPETFAEDAAKALGLEEDAVQTIAQELTKDGKLEAIETEEKPSRAQARIEQLARDRREAERRAEEAERRAKDLEARLEAPGGKEPKKGSERQPEKPSGAPQVDQYDDLEAYLDARDKWNRSQWDEESRRRAAIEAHDKALHSRLVKAHEAMKDVDWDQISDEVKEAATEFQLPEGQRPNGRNWIANEFFFRPETAAAMMLYFTKNPEDYDRISRLPDPVAVTREYSRIEVRQEGSQGPPPKREPSKAPPPFRPLTPSSVPGEADIYSDGLDFDTFKKRRKA